MEKAKKSVDNLQKTIAETEVSPEQQAALDEVSQHIEKFQEDPQTHHQTLRERLENALIDFDADHHGLSESIRVAIYDLSNAGV